MHSRLDYFWNKIKLKMNLKLIVNFQTISWLVNKVLIVF